MKLQDIPKGEDLHGAITKHMDRRFLSSIDLAGHGTVWLTVDRLEKHETLKYQNGSVEKNVLLMYFRETKRPLALNATNIRRIILRLNTSNVDDWAGQKIPLHAEPGTYFGIAGLAVRVGEEAKSKVILPQEE